MPKKKTKKESKDLLNQLKRTQADFENYKKRIETEKKSLIKNANADLMKELIETIIGFEKAMPFIKDKGIKLLVKNFRKTLEKHGLKEIDAKGQFNVNLHEAVMTVKSKDTDNQIVEVVEKGYLLNDKVLKHAKVIVSKKG